MTITVRALALAIVGVVAVVVAVVVVLLWPRHHSGAATGGGPWYTALAAPYAPSTGTKTSACGVTIGPGTVGVAHPRLPCGVRIVVEYGGKQVPTRVIDRGVTVPGHDFDLTRALARRLGLHGVQTIHWRFVR